jgi:hypothetical protein
MKPMEPDELLRADSNEIAALPGEQARALLIRILDAFDRGELSNFDHLILLGIRLAAAGFNGLDLAAVEWASERPSEDRLDIVSMLLSGLWKHRKRGTRITPAALHGLMTLHEAVMPTEATEYQYLLALSEATSAGKEYQDVVRGALEDALRKSLSNPELDRILKDVIRRSLQP